jgi:AcrR family transcriptional regulator
MSPRSESTQPREQLLEATLAYVAKKGVGELSLRQLAAALGTSHRMLVYHFGSKEGLMVEVVRAVEERQRAAAVDLAQDSTLPLGEQMRRMWRRLASPELWPNERLFFEVYGQALQGRANTTALLDGVVDAWLEPMTEVRRRRGVPLRRARAEARLALATVRGLLLDLLVTRDRKGVDDAMELFISTYEAGPPTPATRRATKR